MSLRHLGLRAPLSMPGPKTCGNMSDSVQMRGTLCLFREASRLNGGIGLFFRKMHMSFHRPESRDLWLSSKAVPLCFPTGGLHRLSRKESMETVVL